MLRVKFHTKTNEFIVNFVSKKTLIMFNKDTDLDGMIL